VPGTEVARRLSLQGVRAASNPSPPRGGAQRSRRTAARAPLNTLMARIWQMHDSRLQSARQDGPGAAVALRAS